MSQRFAIRAGRMLLLVGTSSLLAQAVSAQTARRIGQETDHPGQTGLPGPAGQANQPPSIAAAGQEQAPAGAAAGSGSTGGIGEIVVTAERRTSSAQRTAASISVRTGDELRKEGKFQLGDILENVPALSGGAAESSRTSAGGGTDTIGTGLTIRGIASNLGALGSAAATAPAVAVYVDDIFEGVGGDYDLDRVELLRGPQGTLYGRSATAGVVAIHTRDPNLHKIEGFGLAEAGDYALRHFTAAVNMPIVDDKLAVRVSGDYYHRDGFDTDHGTGFDESKSARIKVLAKPTDTLSILLGGAVQYNRDGTGGLAPAYTADRTLVFTGPTDRAGNILNGSGKNHFKQVWADVQWDLGFATLTYIPAYRTWNQNAQIIAAGPGIVVSQPLITPKDHFLTNEVRLTSDSGSKLKWQIGGLQYHNNFVNNTTVSLISPINFFANAADLHKVTDSFGVFGEATYPITDVWRVTGGLRYDHTKINIAEDFTSSSRITLSIPADQGHLRFNDVTYKARTEYDLSPRNLVYASFSTGFSPGDATVTQTPASQPYVLQLKDETLKSLEFGTKNRFLDNKLQVNGSIYYYWYSGFQTAGINTSPPGPVHSYETLVAPLHNYGGELEIVVQPDSNDRASLNLAYVHSRFVDRSQRFIQFIARAKQSGFAPFTADLSYSHRFDLPGGSGLVALFDGRYLAKHDAGPITVEQIALGGLPFVHVPGVAIANFNLTWTAPNGRFSIGGYVRNMTDKRYITKAEADVENVPPAGPTHYIAGASLNVYDPRTFGGVVTFNF